MFLTNYIEKDATQQDIFISKYPSYDGRGIKIAIIDGAVDLSLEGLQKTSEGLPKIIDCFDFTGAGDVDTSVIKEMDSENILIGLSGRKLKIPAKWKNPSGKWHLGIKSLYKPKSIEELKSDKNKTEKLPEIDCIVWNDGQKWLACIETFADLENAKMLTNFRDSFEYGILMNEVEIVYCITVYDDGNLLEIFTPYFDHGSVVAEVAAAHFSLKHNFDGLAPGAQIISLNVSDPETKLKNLSALKKALLKCIELNVDIINYSIKTFGGSAEITQIISGMVNKHNILIFKGAGNQGPLYSTLDNEDICIKNLIFTFGAVTTNEIKKRIHNAPEYINQPSIVSYFSSRGPDKDGCQGVDFVAPGSAIIDIPNFCSVKDRVFHGTSCSSPNATGAIACLLSALKANSIQYSHFSIKFALFKTAYLPENGNKLEFGNGIIQIYDTFEYCRKNVMDKISADLWALKGTKNIYYIVTDENQIVREYNLDLPSLADDTVTGEKAKWTLQLSSNAKKYIEISEVNSNHSFSVKIDTSKIEPGKLYFSEIKVLHPFNQSLGSIFNIPVTVIIPLKITETKNYRIQKEITLYNEISNHLFIDSCFEGRKKCEIKITALGIIKTSLIIQYAEFTNYVSMNSNSEKVLKFTPDSPKQTYSLLCQPKKCYEICFEQEMGFTPKAKFHLELLFNDEENILNAAED